MGLLSVKVIVFTLLLGCLTVYADQLDLLPGSVPPAHPPYHAPPPKPYHVHPPAHPPSHHHSHPPVKPPSHPPAHPPSHHHHDPPSKPPSHPPTKPPSHPPVKPPSHPPVKPPSHPPVKPPSHPPVDPPSHPPVKPPSPPHVPTRKFVAVQGVVYCKSCKYRGFATLLGASPLAGATVKLVCRNTKYRIVEYAKTDKNGYFFIQAPKTVTTYGAHKCQVFLVSSPLHTCNAPTNLHGGLTGATLRYGKPHVGGPLAFDLYTVGPFAFEPSKKIKCPR